MSQMPPFLPPPLAQNSSNSSPPEIKPGFKIRWHGWVGYVACAALSVFLAHNRLISTASITESYPSYLIGIAVGLLIISIGPSWLVWRFSKRPYPATSIVFFVALALGTMGQLSAAKKAREASPELINDLHEVAQAGLKDISKGRPVVAAERLIQTLDKQAAKNGMEGAVSSVIVQFLHELQGYTQALSTVALQAQKLTVPGPDDDPARYDAYIAADGLTLQAVHEEDAFVKNWSVRVDEIVKAKSIPGLANDPMLIGFKNGFGSSAQNLFDLYRGQQDSLTSEIELLTLMKTNLGHWHADSKGQRVFDDANVQKQYDATLKINIAANKRAKQALDKVIAAEKDALQTAF